MLPGGLALAPPEAGEGATPGQMRNLKFTPACRIYSSAIRGNGPSSRPFPFAVRTFVTRQCIVLFAVFARSVSGIFLGFRSALGTDSLEGSATHRRPKHRISAKLAQIQR